MKPSQILDPHIFAEWKIFLSAKKITNVSLFSQGKRGVILQGMLDGRRSTIVAIKIQNPRSDISARIAIEAENLQRVNVLGIGPRLLSHGKFERRDFVIYEFVPGILLGDYLEQGVTTSAWRQIASAVLEQMYLLDCAGLTKEEMHHPPKHVVIDISRPEKVTLLDFERMHVDLSPQNVRQWVQYLCGSYVQEKTGYSLEHETLRPLLVAYKIALECYLQKKISKPDLEFTKLKKFLHL